MDHFLTGFADELIKLSAQPQAEVSAGPYPETGVQQKVNLKPGEMPAPSQSKRAPTPLTSMNETAGRTEVA